MDNQPTRFLVISDMHLGDNRGGPVMSMEEMVEAINSLASDCVINLNDTVAPLHRLVSCKGQTTEETYRHHWQTYAEAFRSRIRVPLIDVATQRDLPIWSSIAGNAPEGCSSFGNTHVLWTCPEQEGGHSPRQLDWLTNQIKSRSNAKWLVASHVPIRGSVPWTSCEFLACSELLKNALHSHAQYAVCLGGHFHLSHAEILREGNCFLSICGPLNMVKAGNESYARRVTFLGDKLHIENIHLNKNRVVQDWEFSRNS